jgi:hypothetical protein
MFLILFKISNIVVDYVNYYGNFTAKIFKNLFNKLCANIKKQYESVNIHIDSTQ